MTFRDELGASRARMETLQQRVDELEAENRALRERDVDDAAAPAPTRRSRGAPAVMALVLSCAIAGTYALAQRSGLGTTLLLVGLALGASFLVSRALIEHVHSGFILVLSGRRYADGRAHRLVHEGWTLRMPFVEVADRMDVRIRRCEVDVENVYGNDNVPLRLRVGALIRLASAEPAVRDAIDRFLGRPMEEVDTVATQILTSNLREAAVSVSSADIAAAPDRLARAVAQRATGDFERLGLVFERVHVEVLRAAE